MTRLTAAIVGSGPSGFYAAEALLKSGLWRVDMIERLPVPFGLVRSGVAPDHPKLKQPVLLYDRIARMPAFTYFGNVTVGRDVAVHELQRMYHAVIFACGAETDRRLAIPGETLRGSHTATEFVGWYNGHPDYCDRTFDLSQEVAVIIGQGNVAADVCRILAKDVDALRRTDIAEHALDALAESRVREIHLVGRRGPAQAKFSSEELRELGEVPGLEPVVDARELLLNDRSTREVEDRMNRAAARNMELFRQFSERSASDTVRRRCYFHFCRSPVAISGLEHVTGVVLERNHLVGDAYSQQAAGTGETDELGCGLVFRSIGYGGMPIAGIEFDAKRGVFANTAGRLIRDGSAAPGLYATGWIKRGPSGIIGTNRADSLETVAAIQADAPELERHERPGAPALNAVLRERGVAVVDYEGWLAIDSLEIARGTVCGKPREKFTTREDMLSCVQLCSTTA
jgi:ferredoxin--NADP+ reductase